MKQPLVIANWKLNPGTVAEAKMLWQDINKKIPKGNTATVVVAPPYIFIPEVSKRKSIVQVGAQDAAPEERGALTGEVGPAMLASFGVQYVIVGHSERRAMGESDGLIHKKVRALLKRRMTPVVCVGEKVRDEGGQYLSFIAEQVKALSKDLTASEIAKVVIAYEPIWAIGTGATATPADVKEMQLFLMTTLSKLYDRKVAAKVRLIYGGSVKESNAAILATEGGMNGFLVGGASLNAVEFGAIVQACNKK